MLRKQEIGRLLGIVDQIESLSVVRRHRAASRSSAQLQSQRA
jgi:hypothetical protein